MEWTRTIRRRSEDDALIRGTIKASNGQTLFQPGNGFLSLFSREKPRPKYEMNYEFILFVHYLGDCVLRYVTTDQPTDR